MKTSCITHPANEQLVIIRKWQIEFCKGNECAAALLSYFEYWHNWKINTDSYNKKSNDVAANHDEPRSLSEDVYQYHSLQELSDGILNLYGIKTVNEAIKSLEGLGVISIHANPNPKYRYDRTKHYQFYPEICNEWLKNYTAGKNTISTRQNCLLDLVNLPNREGKNADSISPINDDSSELDINNPQNATNPDNSRSGNFAISSRQNCAVDLAILPNREGKNARPFGKNAEPITKINNKEIKDQSINNARENFAYENPDEFLAHEEPLTQTIVRALIEKGLSVNQFQYPDTAPILKALIAKGATTDTFCKAYDISIRTTHGKGFGMKYIAKVVMSLLEPIAQASTQSQQIASEKTSYESDLSKGYWIEEDE